VYFSSWRTARSEPNYIVQPQLARFFERPKKTEQKEKGHCHFVIVPSTTGETKIRMLKTGNARGNTKNVH
jgi:hypothetical protein